MSDQIDFVFTSLIEHHLRKDLHNRIALGVRETSLNEDTRYLMFKVNFKLEKAVAGRKFYNCPSVNSIGNIASHWKVIGSYLLLDIGHNVVNIAHLVDYTKINVKRIRFCLQTGHKIAQMRNLLYMAVFRDEGYVDLLALLMKSLRAKGSFNNETTDILILTHPSMANAIGEKVVPHGLALNFWYLDFVQLMDAARARLLIFDYPYIGSYDKMLYIDTDILINSNINKIFDLPIEKGILYVGSEMTLASYFHGGWMYGDHPEVDLNQPAFSSGIMFFRNCPEVKDMFYATVGHIHDDLLVKRNEPPTCLDQPYIVFNAAIRKMYDTRMINDFIRTGRSPEIVEDNVVLYHFAGDIGTSFTKKQWMEAFIEKIIDFKPGTVSI